MGIAWEHLRLCPFCPLHPPPCTSTLKVRKTKVRQVLRVDKPVFAHDAQCQKNACGEHLPIPHPDHNCRNKAPEHNVQADFRVVWTSSLSI